jgi:hypothetical protein
MLLRIGDSARSIGWAMLSQELWRFVPFLYKDYRDFSSRRRYQGMARVPVPDSAFLQGLDKRLLGAVSTTAETRLADSFAA